MLVKKNRSGLLDDVAIVLRDRPERRDGIGLVAQLTLAVVESIGTDVTLSIIPTMPGREGV